MKLLTVVGARPQFIKAATISRAIIKFNEINEDVIQEVIVHTGQHYDSNMSDIFFEEMEIPKPKYSLGVNGGGHGEMTGRQLEALEQVMLKEKPNWVLVYGDTNSTLAGALAAAKLHIPVVHVEAGLRSFNMAMPEEVNRILTDNVSKLLCCPSQTALNNLDLEGFGRRDCHVVNVGDVMFDAALHYSEKACAPEGFEVNEGFVLATIHRAENTDDSCRLENIVKGLNFLNKTIPVVCPLHPRTRGLINSIGINVEFSILEPVSYFEMLWLLKASSVVVTDSGGLQKEAYFFGRSCLTVRDQTEWLELIDAGVNKLVNVTPNLGEVLKASIAEEGVGRFESGLYGDGTAAKKVLDVLMGLG